MNNEYISKYSKFDTHFHRTDPWKHIPWEDEPSGSWRKVLSGAGLLVILLIVFII